MSSSLPPEKPVSPTARVSPDPLGLGKTSGQRGAEIMAGVRAETMPSPVTIALSRTAGRVVVRVMMKLSRSVSKETINFLPVRTGGITALIKEAVTPIKEKLLLVDIAAGFSPRGMELAQVFPDAEVIEIDLPDVIQEKKKRLQKARDVTIPPNLEWRAADMGVTALSEVLQNKLAHAISAEGLTPYFAPDELIRIARQIRDNLKPGGVFACDMAWKRGINQSGESGRFLSRQAGEFVGAMENQEQVYKIFKEAGYDEVQVYLPSEAAAKYNLPQPVMDLQFLVIARRKLETASEPKVAVTSTPKVEAVSKEDKAPKVEATPKPETSAKAEAVSKEDKAPKVEATPKPETSAKTEAVPPETKVPKVEPAAKPEATPKTDSEKKI